MVLITVNCSIIAYFMFSLEFLKFVVALKKKDSK
jgi:hypothetical protein